MYTTLVISNELERVLSITSNLLVLRRYKLNREGVK
jgi:hypothetical protein